MKKSYKVMILSILMFLVYLLLKFVLLPFLIGDISNASDIERKVISALYICLLLSCLITYGMGLKLIYSGDNKGDDLKWLIK